MDLFVSSQVEPAAVALERYLPVKAAAEAYGNNEQYLRRLLRAGRLQGGKIGQLWLISRASLEAHLRKAHTLQDQRFGPQGMVPQSKGR